MLWPKASPLDLDFGLCAWAKLFNYHKEDIVYTLEEIFPESKLKMISRVKLGGTLSADHSCSVQIKPDTGNFCWPQMTSDQAMVFKDNKKH